MTVRSEHDPDEWGGEEATRVTSPFEPGGFFANRFRIEREIAVGGMGTVYQATDLRTERQVALKVLKKDRHPDEEARQRFLREAEILVSMDHPGIVRIRGFGHAPDGTPWLAMELLQGETLLDRVRREGPQDPARVVPIISATSDALEAAHGWGVVHRDLKPENIFLPVDGTERVKVLDFGLSSIAGSAKLTATGTIIGTPRYMAPEQIRSARSADSRVDVYALGVIAYEALAGASPFTASDHGQLLGAILTGRRRSLADVRPDLPASLDAVVGRALEPDPNERFATVAELAEAFAAAVGTPSGRRQPQLSSDEALRSLSSDALQPSRSWAEPLDPERFGEAATDGPEEGAAQVEEGASDSPRFSSVSPPAHAPAAGRSLVPVALAVAVGCALGLVGLALAALLLGT